MAMRLPSLSPRTDKTDRLLCPDTSSRQARLLTHADGSAACGASAAHSRRRNQLGDDRTGVPAGMSRRIKESCPARRVDNPGGHLAGRRVIGARVASPGAFFASHAALPVASPVLLTP